MRPFIPGALIAIVMSAIFVMPSFKTVDSALDIRVEGTLGSWIVRPLTIPENVRKILAEDTDFTYALCSLPRSEEMSLLEPLVYDRSQLSIILSGHDLANSIHRPERCMRAQGHKNLIVESKTMQTDAGHELPITQILSEQDVTFDTPEGQRTFTHKCLTYYFFVGQNETTASHTERTMIDIKDRVLGGEAQRWAYVLATMAYVDEHQYGGDLDLKMADTKIRQLLSELADQQIHWDRINP